MLVAEYVTHHQTSLIWIYATWDAAVYGIWAARPDWPEHDRDLLVQQAHGDLPQRWETSSLHNFIRVTVHPVHTQTEDRFEVRVKGTRNGVSFDDLVRHHDSLLDQAHADDLATEWNAKPLPGAEDGSVYYVVPTSG